MNWKKDKPRCMPAFVVSKCFSVKHSTHKCVLCIVFFLKSLKALYVQTLKYTRVILPWNLILTNELSNISSLVLTGIDSLFSLSSLLSVFTMFSLSTACLRSFWLELKFLQSEHVLHTEIFHLLQSVELNTFSRPKPHWEHWWLDPYKIKVGNG